MSNLNNNSIEALKKLQEIEENEILERNVKIRLRDPVKTRNQYGRERVFLSWEYIVVGYQNPEWKLRKCSLGSSEAKVILDKAPFSESGIYRVLAKRDTNGFYKWTQIDLLEGANDESFEQSEGNQ